MVETTTTERGRMEQALVKAFAGRTVTSSVLAAYGDAIEAAAEQDARLAACVAALEGLVDHAARLCSVKREGKRCVPIDDAVALLARIRGTTP